MDEKHLHSFDFVLILSWSSLFWFKAFPILVVLWICNIPYQFMPLVCLLMSYQEALNSLGGEDSWQSGFLRLSFWRPSHLSFPSCSLFPCLLWSELPSPFILLPMGLGFFVTSSQHRRLKSSANVFDPLTCYCRALSHNSLKGTDLFCMYLNILLLWATMWSSVLEGELKGHG